MTKRMLMGLAAALLIVGCGSSTDYSQEERAKQSPAEEGSDARIKLNQLGYFINAPKLAMVPATDATAFRVLSSATNEVVFEGALSSPQTWDAMGSEVFKVADFSQLQAEGHYRVAVEGVEHSYEFEVGNDVYSTVHNAALKAYYFNRASTELTPEYAGEYARPLGHPDTHVKIYKNAASKARPEGSEFAAPKGWYDAGDYGKYIVNSGISTYTLLAAYEHFPDFYSELKVNIPESNNGVPDILDEIMWNLEWMEAMQDPNDGGVYHKLTTEHFSGAVMPHEATEQRYFIMKSTAAALDFAAVMAVASRVYRPFDEAFPGKADAYRTAAINAWEWAQKNPDVLYVQPRGEGVSTGAYGDKTLDDEFAWAAAELFILTGEPAYWEAFKQQAAHAVEPGWASVSGLAYISLANAGRTLLSGADYEMVAQDIVASADRMLDVYLGSSYQVPIGERDFYWGGNSGTLNRAWIMLEANKIAPKQGYIDAAFAAVDYMFGRNPTGYSFVTGFGDKPSVGIHHRPSYADNIEAPVPGWLAGGAHSGQQDGCLYPSDAPAKSYLDEWCSYSTNEITINWNAPLVYLLAALQSH